ncbi:MAG TPA: N-acetylglucosamine-6-phosphate deacetylase [Synergistaceae bacterium]|nr:N-acetylglucosamine-6-phosphate deacetylase [Synergistaceae bacterium]HPJ24977.1 N-acetylglucosamine-6-phosphate deacetylase [Synergistaceae bacterium]HPQ36959.1 N-acetylglucosamine-6-phosphate deacetylase [Synergistaceae bacterium]
MLQAIVNARIVLEDRVLESGVVLHDAKIRGVYETRENNLPEGIPLYDAQGAFVLPGMIDIHTHGAVGRDVMDGDVQGIREISSFLASRGVTSFCPTTMTMPLKAIEKAIEKVRQCRKEGPPGASILGIHLEGPFISSRYKGAQNSRDIQDPMAEWVLERKEDIRIVTYASEKDPQGEFCSALAKEGIRLSLGHTGASYEDVFRAQEYGALSASHLFNGMPPIHHRDPGVVGGVLKSSLYAELIADGVHVHPAFFDLVIRMKSPQKVILISDSMRAAGLKEGEYDFGGQKVRVSRGEARLADGTLAGSVLTLDKAFRNVFYQGGVSLPQMARLTATNAADMLGLFHKGRIAKGADADLLFLDGALEVQRTLVEGREVFLRKGGKRES